MCGIAGIYNLDGAPVSTDELLEMTRLIRHRGPDDEGFVIINCRQKTAQPCHHDETMEAVKKETVPLQQVRPADLAFGFRRLSILDLSEHGHQPMASDDGRLWIIFNGEIYNYIELRQELKSLGFSFHTATDTEVILKAWQAWGSGCLPRFNGMWALAIWDSQKGELFCARDRFGIKPFYYTFDQRTFRFGSEVKQLLLNLPDRALNEAMIYRSLKLNSFIAYGDETYFKNIHSLRPAHFLRIQNGGLEIRRWYDLETDTFEQSGLSLDEATEGYLDLFNDAVKLRMRSDVEVGSCLSGGLDSSAIVGSAAAQTDRTFRTFSAYYDLGPLYDERKWIQLVGSKTGVQTHFISPTADMLLGDLDRMTFVNDFPVTGPSLISQHYVMKLARQNDVTVLLDGQGSDEITGGYNHTFYRYYADLLRGFKWGRFLREYPYYLRVNQKGGPLAKILKTLFTVVTSESGIYKKEARHQLLNPLSRKFDDSGLFENVRDLPTSRLSNFLYNLLTTTMLPSLLHFEDRNSMAYSIESRVPFLDYRLVEFAFSLPAEYKVHKNFGKYIHRRALMRIVPREIAERRDKVSFSSPGDALWLKNELRPWAQAVFSSSQFKKRGIYDHARIARAFQSYLNGQTRFAKTIWRVLMLERWFDLFIDSDRYKEINLR